MKKILVTGDQGFLGKYLVNRLMDDGNMLYGYDIKTTTIFPDEPVDLVYHLASHVNAFGSVENPTQGLENVEVLFKVLEWMRYSGSKNIVFSSSRECYSCVNSYGASKIACEAFLRSYCSSYGFGAVSCRLANLYGPGNLGFRFVDSTIERARKNEDIEVYGGKDKVLNFLYIEDAVTELIKASEIIKPFEHKVVECAYPQSYALVDLAKIIIDKTGSKSKIVMLPNRLGETLQYYPEHTEVKPTVTIEEGIDRCLSQS